MTPPSFNDTFQLTQSVAFLLQSACSCGFLFSQDLSDSNTHVLFKLFLSQPSQDYHGMYSSKDQLSILISWVGNHSWFFTVNPAYHKSFSLSLVSLLFVFSFWDKKVPRDWGWPQAHGTAKYLQLDPPNARLYLPSSGITDMLAPRTWSVPPCHCVLSQSFSLHLFSSLQSFHCVPHHFLSRLDLWN